MGYTTEFSGQINLSRKLTFSEAKEWIILADGYDSIAVEKATGIYAYLQWVPTENLDAIVWNGHGKFYNYVELLEWLCGKWLKERGIVANGKLYYSGEETEDSGRITVTDNIVERHPSTIENIIQGKPLTTQRLAEMALEAITNNKDTYRLADDISAKQEGT
ncbi:MAG: hypothetical protein LBI48_01950 [Burkholderiaceae bacterium]|jgi:hypothetical protein|nr:hypothetical protein [Burkholderiaceae bacterium]